MSRMRKIARSGPAKYILIILLSLLLLLLLFVIIIFTFFFLIRETMKFKTFFQSETCVIGALLSMKTALYISYLVCDQVYHFLNFFIFFNFFYFFLFFLFFLLTVRTHQ